MKGGSRRVATLDRHQTQVFSSVATRRELFLPSSPWTEVHGYLQCVAPRHDELFSIENSEGLSWCFQPVESHRIGCSNCVGTAGSARHIPIGPRDVAGRLQN